MTDIIKKQEEIVSDFDLKKSEQQKSENTSAEILKVALELLKQIQMKSAVDEPVVEEEDEPSDFDYEGYCDDMKRATLAALEESHNHHIIRYSDEYVIFCKKLTCRIQQSFNEDSMQPFSDTRERTLCVIKIISWSIEEASQDELVMSFMSLGAEMVGVSFLDDIKGNL